MDQFDLAQPVIIKSFGTSSDTANNGTPNTTDSLFSYVKKLVVDIGAILSSLVVLARDKTDIMLTDKTTTANATYIGYAIAGTVTSAVSWRIQKIVTDVSGNITITNSGGNNTYAYKWDDRATTVTYS